MPMLPPRASDASSRPSLARRSSGVLFSRQTRSVCAGDLPRLRLLTPLLSSIDYIRLSTTVATNALLERKGKKHALVITKGFKDLLLIGNQSRPRIFDLNIRRPSPLYSTVLEVDERVTLVGYTSDPEGEKNALLWNEDGTLQRGYRGPGRDAE